METLISLLVQIPGVGGILESPVRSILGAIYLFSYSCLIVFSAAKQKEKLHGGGGGNDSNILRWGSLKNTSTILTVVSSSPLSCTPLSI